MLHSKFKHQLNLRLLVEFCENWNGQLKWVHRCHSSQPIPGKLVFIINSVSLCQVFFWPGIFESDAKRFQCSICCIIFRIFSIFGFENGFSQNRKSVAMNFNNGAFLHLPRPLKSRANSLPMDQCCYREVVHFHLFRLNFHLVN